MGITVRTEETEAIQRVTAIREPNMTEIERIVEQLRKSYEGEAWHGPSVLEALQDVSVASAAQRPFHSAHTIWEIVEHLRLTERLVYDRLHGQRFLSLPPAEAWRPQPYPSESAWKELLGALQQGHLELRQAISTLKADKLNETIPQRDHTYYDMLHGTVQHNIYHAGQISLIKKALL